MNRLEQILAHKRAELEERQQRLPLALLEKQALSTPPPPSFAAALRRQPGQPLRLIAEVKRASPSRGVLSANLNAAELAKTYLTHGASAISVLTDERFFCGSLDDLRKVVNLPEFPPVLRKDFILSPYQILEARAAGAAAVLLIAACLSADELGELYGFTRQCGMDALIEVHTLAELEQALVCQPAIIGVNNRDLTTFEVHLETALNLIKRIPPAIIRVAESGIRTREDVCWLDEAGFDALLIGESLVTSPDPGQKLSELLGRRG
jgi:indole-3-glycerol phosphate synthase